MGLPLDLVGQSFGQLTVLHKDDVRVGGQVKWVAQCTCGNTKSFYGHNLKKGNVKSCGCTNRTRQANAIVIDLTGQKFGQLEVLGMGDLVNKELYWHVRCNCGKETQVRGYLLRGGRQNTCGCGVVEASKHRKMDLTETSSFFLTYLEEAGKQGRNRMIKCRCQCGKEVILMAKAYIHAKTKSCGCYLRISRKW